MSKHEWWADMMDNEPIPEYNADLAAYDGEFPEFYFNPITSRMAILNALTGKAYTDAKGLTYRMGSKDEYRFYVVIMGEQKNPKEACKVFFDSPQQYARATGIKVSSESKARLAERRSMFKT